MTLDRAIDETRAKYHARVTLLPKKLLMLSCTNAVVHRCIEDYLAGKVTLEDALINIIEKQNEGMSVMLKTLIEYSDKFRPPLVVTEGLK